MSKCFCGINSIVIEQGKRMRRYLPRFTLTTVVAFVSVLVCLIQVPYVLLSPGPIFNTIGMVDGHDLISISGKETYATTGSLNMTTVSEFGGPETGVSVGQAIWAWIHTSERVMPREALYPENMTEAQSRQQNVEAFSTSQSYAVAAAMNYLKLPVVESVVISSIEAGGPAEGTLHAADVITKINSKNVSTPAEVVSIIRAQPVGTAFVFTIVRKGVSHDYTLKTKARKDDPSTTENEAGIPFVGVGVDSSYAATFPITFGLDNVGGPSAGTMFAIGIIDKLTPGQLAQGKVIAGTGTIDPDGTVGPIGGIAQKLIGARSHGAVLFLAPADNCDEVKGHIPDGLTVTPMSTLAEGVAAINDFNAGKKLPQCSAK